jgi:chromosome segregation ATPase
MGFKKTTTLVLFFLLLVTIVFFSAAVIVYQNSMTHLNDDLRERKQDIIDMQGQIDGLSYNLTSLKQAYGLQLLREENLSSQFSSVKEAKEDLEATRSELQAEIADLTAELTQKTVDLNMMTFQLNETNSLLRSLNESYLKVVDDAEDICAAAESLNISDCRKY